MGSGRDEAGGVVFLNNERADAARRIEVRTSQHGGVDPAVLLAEIGLPAILLGRFRPARRHARRHLAAPAQARADELDRHELDRLLGAGAMAVGPLVLLAKRLLQMSNHSGIDRAFRHRHREFIALALIVQRRRALEPGAVAGKTLHGGRPRPPAGSVVCSSLTRGSCPVAVTRKVTISTCCAIRVSWVTERIDCSENVMEAEGKWRTFFATENWTAGNAWGELLGTVVIWCAPASPGAQERTSIFTLAVSFLARSAQLRTSPSSASASP